MRTIAHWLVLLACLFQLPSLAADKPNLSYRLGSGDVIRITVFQNPDLALETRVSESGTITYPFNRLGEPGGPHPGSGGKLIAKGLKDGGYVQAPQVNIGLTGCAAAKSQYSAR